MVTTQYTTHTPKPADHSYQQLTVRRQDIGYAIKLTKVDYTFKLPSVCINPFFVLNKASEVNPIVRRLNVIFRNKLI